MLQTTWSADVLGGRGASVYPVDLMIEASDRQGLLRDISEVFAREKMNVIGVKTQSRRNAAFMQFTVEVSSASQVQRACTLLGEVRGSFGRPARRERPPPNALRQRLAHFPQRNARKHLPRPKRFHIISASSGS
ncbi:ACT domain-containing protein [Burkholderia thailandensis]|uniref:ACT domain-containing protein n=1 Tax=Burkholderia thailandensis TaxID=57975 RepID=UPI001EE2B4AF|nr:ACT domain-containing protein [Burkholderia thailandensis]